MGLEIIYKIDLQEGSYPYTNAFLVIVDDPTGTPVLKKFKLSDLSIGPTQIQDFAITASKIFINIPILEGDAWTDNSPGAGSIAWNEHTLYYNGAAYTISASNTNLKYIYWLNGATSYSKSNTNPTLTDGDFIIAVNITGTHDLAWNAIANQVIGSAYIEDAAILTAKINDLAVSEAKIGALAVTAAKIANATITASQIANATITAANIANATITYAQIADATITGAKIGNLQVDTLQIKGSAVDYSKRQTVYTGSIAVSGLTTGTYYNYVDVTHNLGKNMMITAAADPSSVINANNGSQASAYNINTNTFRVTVTKNVTGGTVYYAYW